MKYSSANLKLTKTQLSKIVQSRRFLGRIPRTLMRPDLLLIKIVLKSIAKSVFYTTWINSGSINSKRRNS